MKAPTAKAKAAKPRFFRTAADFRAWLEKNHDSATELLVGFHKKATGRPSITWPEAVDQALCFGWIDGVRRSLDDESYCNRFTPRRRGSNWSAVNIKKVEALLAAGLMHPSGRAAFDARLESRSRVYSYEQSSHEFNSAYEEELRANRDAWHFFQAQAPWYRRVSIHWVMSAKKEETRRRRLATLIDDSAHGRTLKGLPAAKARRP